MSDLKIYKDFLINPITFFVDDMNDELTFGYTNNHKTVDYNISLIYSLVGNYDESLKQSKNGLTCVFPVGRFIVILKISKDKTIKEMIFLDFRAQYSTFEDMAGLFSDNILKSIKKIKYEWNEMYSDDMEFLVGIAHAYN
jgi:hypothetical protein